MPLNLIYQNPTSNGKIYQAGWDEIPVLPQLAKIDVVILAAQELPFPPGYQLGKYRAKIIRAPLNDNFSPSKQELVDIWNRATTAAIAAAKYNQEGKNVLITCHKGWN